MTPSTFRRLVFLDIDGVLNCQSWYLSREGRAAAEVARQSSRALEAERAARIAADGVAPRTADIDRGEYRRARALAHLNPRNVHWLNELLRASDADVVVSSTWRLLYGLDEIKSHLVERGLERPDALIDVTPRLQCGTEFWGENSKIGRGMEIECWLLQHVPHSELASTRIVILDDDSDFGRLRSWHLKTDNFHGALHQNHVRRALRMFQRQGARAAGAVLLTPNRHWFEAAASTLYGGAA